MIKVRRDAETDGVLAARKKDLVHQVVVEEDKITNEDEPSAAH